MKTILIEVAEKDENLLMDFLAKFKIKSRTIMEEEKAMAKWIDEGMESEEVDETTVYKTLSKYGVKV